MDASMCVSCQPGTYSALQGASNCSDCGVGYFQSESSQSACFSCVDYYQDNTLQSNPSKTGCEVNDILAQRLSLAEVFFNDGVSWYLTFTIAATFMAVAGIVGYSREAQPDRLANYTRMEAVYNSFASGFFFASEMFLSIAMWERSKALSIILALSRLVHFFGGMTIVTAMFGSLEMAQRLDHYMPGTSALRQSLDSEFTRENVYLVETVGLLAFADVCMVQFMPWKACKFYRLSEGYPNMMLLKLCMSIKWAHSLMAIFTELIYLSLYSVGDAADTNKIVLFLMNIVFGVIVVLSDTLVLCVRAEVLKEDEEKRVASEEKRVASEEKKRKLEGLKSDAKERQKEEEENDEDKGEHEGRSTFFTVTKSLYPKGASHHHHHHQQTTTTTKDRSKAPSIRNPLASAEEGEGGNQELTTDVEMRSQPRTQRQSAGLELAAVYHADHSSSSEDEESGREATGEYFTTFSDVNPMHTVENLESADHIPMDDRAESVSMAPSQGLERAL
jgi:hypothetical protein